jgi:polysaccharide biosynthesis protein PslH
MKMFFFFHFLPYPPNDGSSIYTYNRIECLRERHEAIVLAPMRRQSDPKSVETLRGRGWQIETVSKPNVNKVKAVMARVKALLSSCPAQWVLGWDDAIGRELERQIRNHRPDVVVIEHLQTARFLPYIRNATDAPIVFCNHNVEYLWEARIAQQSGFTFNGILRRLQLSKVKKVERYVNTIAKVAFAISDHDRDILRELAPDGNIHTLPAGVDMRYFVADDKVEQENRVVFTGVLSSASSVDGTTWLVNQVYPLALRNIPDLRVDIVGRDPWPPIVALADTPGVSVEPNVPDVRPYVNRAKIFVVPVWPDSGVRLKILEAFAMGKAVVSTSKAAEGLNVVDGTHLLIRDEPEGFAEAIIRLITNSDERERLAAAGLELARREYSWEASSALFEHHLAEALHSGSR